MFEKLKQKFGFSDSSLPEQPPMTLLAPLSGHVIALDTIDDEVFSKGMLGQGVAIIPSEGRLISPVNGRVEQVFDTLHAITILSNEGLEVLIHIGLETVSLQGKYFKAYVQSGDSVQAGQLLIRFDVNAIEKEGYDPVTPVLVNGLSVEILKLGAVTAGEPLFRARR